MPAQATPESYVPIPPEPLLDHPAKFSAAVLDAIARAYYRYVGESRTVLDPFAGVGGIHDLRDHPLIPEEALPRTFGIEIEPEWAATSGLTRCADATIPAAYRTDQGDFFPWGAIITSVCYGNRLADRYRGRTITCRACDGTGRCVHDDHVHGLITEQCGLCEGTGQRPTRRYGYANSLNRDPSDGSSAAMQWGPAYRTFHAPLPLLWARHTTDDAVAIINISDHVRGGQEQGVHLWWASAMVSSGAWRYETAIPVVTPRQRNGANREARVGCEWLLVYTRRA